MLASTQPPGSPVRLVVVMIFVFKPTAVEAESVLRNVHEIRPSNPVIEVVCQPTTVTGAQKMQALPKPYQLRLAVDSLWFGGDVDVPAITEKVALNALNPDTMTFWLPIYPLSRRSTNNLLPGSSLISDHYFSMYVGWDEEADDEKHAMWLKEQMLELEKYSDGTYLADTDPQTRPTRHWSDDAGQRLMAIRKKWDPTGVLCGYLDAGDKSGIHGLSNKLSWENPK